MRGCEACPKAAVSQAQQARRQHRARLPCAQVDRHPHALARDGGSAVAAKRAAEPRRPAHCQHEQAPGTAHEPGRLAPQPREHCELVGGRDSVAGAEPVAGGHGQVGAAGALARCVLLLLCPTFYYCNCACCVGRPSDRLTCLKGPCMLQLHAETAQ
eukprot:365917-Chlamydomonas_euryale.AAC.14